jgi:hypothetical protein
VPWDVPVDAGILLDKAAMLGVSIKERSCIICHLLFKSSLICMKKSERERDNNVNVYIQKSLHSSA